MGIIRTEIRLTNVDDQALAGSGHLEASAIRSEVVMAVVDTGATSLTISEALRARLGLKTLGPRRAVLADGRVIDCDRAGPVEVEFENRNSIGTALVVPADVGVLLGALQLEDMDLVPNPLTQQLTVNPESPDRARWLAVGWRSGPPASP